MLSYALAALLLFVPLVLGGGASIWLGRALALQILAEKSDLPPWLEALAPLKGRWLRLLLTAPAILFAMATVFLIVVAPLYYLISLAISLYYYTPVLGCLLIGLLGILTIAALVTLRKAKRAGIAAGERTR